MYGDCETTQLIQHGTPVGEMAISVASLLFVEPSGEGMMLSFWGDPSLGRGAPLRFFRHALEHAKRLVFYNAAFDLALAAGGDEAAVRRWWRRTFDPYKVPGASCFTTLSPSPLAQPARPARFPSPFTACLACTQLLRDAFGASVRLKLDVLLRDNGLAPKTASGLEAVRMYADGRHDELERYNRADVEALRSLVRA